MNRDILLNTICRYHWVVSVIRDTHNYRASTFTYNLKDRPLCDLEREVIEMYKVLKGEIIRALTVRLKQYESNRKSHVEQKTADKQFYRFLQATGYILETDPWKLPMHRLLKIYSVYFKDLDKLKKDLDKKNQSPYIG